MQIDALIIRHTLNVTLNEIALQTEWQQFITNMFLLNKVNSLEKRRSIFFM